MDMDQLFVAALAVIAIGVSFVGGIMAIAALMKIASLRKELMDVRWNLQTLRTNLAKMPPPVAAPAAATAPVQQPASSQAASIPVAPPASTPSPGTHPAPAPARPMPPMSRIATPPTPLAPANDSLHGIESQIGQRWIAWVGAIVVLLSAVFFLKYAFDNRWIGPTGQVVICAVAGLGFLTFGSRFVAKSWRILGQCLMGLGLGILYATFYAAFSVYTPPVMSQNMAFAFLIAVTIAGMSLAVLHDALTLAFIAVLGGLLTPILVSTGQDGRDVLFSYLLLLDLGVLAVAFFKHWRMLDTLAMVGTFIMYAGWFSKFYTPLVIGPALAWLAAFYLLFLILPFAYHLVRKQNITAERFLMALANAIFAGGFAWHMLHQEYLFTMGFVCLGMAAAYLILGTLIRRRLPQDTSSLFSVIAMTVTFLTLAVPMQLQAHGILLAWVAEAPVLAFLAYRFRYSPARILAALVLLVAIGRLFLSETHWPLHTGLFVPFFNKQFLSALTVPAAAAAFAFIHHYFRNQGTPTDRALKLIAALGAGILALIILHAEIFGWLKNDFSPSAANSTATALWAAGALAYLLSGIKALRASPWIWSVGTLLLLIAALLGAAGFDEQLARPYLLFANPRFFAGLFVVFALFAYAWVIHRTKSAGADSASQFTGVFFTAGIIALLALLSTEVYAFCDNTITGQMSITLVWSLYAAALLTLGFAQRWRPLRISGLALFGLSALKLVLVDLTNLNGVYRIIAFFVLGLLMLAASYLYNLLEKRLSNLPANPLPTNDTTPIGEAK